MGQSRESEIARNNSPSSTVIRPSAPTVAAHAIKICFLSGRLARSSARKASSSRIRSVEPSGENSKRACDHPSAPSHPSQMPRRPPQAKTRRVEPTPRARLSPTRPAARTTCTAAAEKGDFTK